MPTFSELIQEIFQELNHLRTNPASFAERMQEVLQQVKENKAMHRQQAVPVMTREGRGAVQEAIDFVRGLTPLAPLNWSEGLYRAA